MTGAPAARARGALDLQLVTHAADEVLADRQAEAGAMLAPLRRQLAEGLERIINFMK